MTIRGKILEDARRATEGDRNKAYGDPQVNLRHIAEQWNLYIAQRFGWNIHLTPQDVAWMMVDVKKARTYKGVTRDNFVDASAYAAIAGECALTAQKLEDEADANDC